MPRDDEFAAYVAARWQLLVRSAVLLGCALSEAEDVTQTALTRCYTRWDKVSVADDRDAYVYRVLVNCLRDSKRRRWWGERPVADPEQHRARAPLFDNTDAVAAADAVARAVGGLSAEQRAVVVLRFYSHLSEAQTARALGIPAGTVKSRMSRALATLASNPHLADLTGTPRDRSPS
ncbi:SigE family RNA polymerase sigma factor [Pedococcus sp. 5OH_020]|uniref:SigE family RNA polymerase sigma factor n=1 Tax=Pedococcus sp. 5OH_020 TaxID=2989814 RepID=UPI0022E9AF8F|nr:SigE family RNA polymerase sigma factor [Pedococcus sp. 5OH_020]